MSGVLKVKCCDGLLFVVDEVVIKVGGVVCFSL